MTQEAYTLTRQSLDRCSYYCNVNARRLSNVGGRMPRGPPAPASITQPQKLGGFALP